MIDGYAVAGLILVISGWLIQLYYSAFWKVFALSLKFVVIYAIGSIFLTISALKAGHPVFGFLNLLAFIVALVAGYFAKKARG